MGQKTNPILLQIEKTKNWDSKYVATKTYEHSIYAKKDFELWNFIFKFLNRNGFVLKTCWINYCQKSLHIFVSYYQDRFSFKESLDNKNVFLKNLLETLTRMTNNKFKVVLIIQKLSNNYFKKVFRNRKVLKKVLVPLKRYKKEIMFWKLVHYIFICVLHTNSSNLLNYFLADTIKQFQNHNTFLNTVRRFFFILNKSVNYRLRGVKIIFKGRINGWPRARKKILNLINTVSDNELSLSFNEKTSFTKNGTLGIKIWIKEG